jgi:hypothetical protein
MDPENWRIERTDLQHLADIAGAEDLVDDGKLVRVLGREVWREHALLRAPPPQQLARCARRAAAAPTPASAAGHVLAPQSQGFRASSEERMVAKGRGETAGCSASSFIEPG